MDNIIEHVNDALLAVDSAPERLRIFVQKHLQMVRDYPELAEVLIVELRQSSKFMREYTPVKFAEYLDIIEQILRDGIDAGDFGPSLSPRLAKRIIFGALEEVCATWLRFRRDGLVSPFDLEQAGAQLWEILSRGFLLSGIMYKRGALNENISFSKKGHGPLHHARVEKRWQWFRS